MKNNAKTIGLNYKSCFINYNCYEVIIKFYQLHKENYYYYY